MRKSRGPQYPLVILLCIQAVMMVIIAWKTAPGWDEWGHLPSGLYSLQYGDYTPYCVNPPLTRLWVALPVWLMGGGIAYEPLPSLAGFRAEGFLGLAYIEQHGPGTFFWMSVARTAAIPIALLGTYLIWSIGTRLFDRLAAVFASTFWVFSPTVLTFGASITPDVTAAVFGLLASWRCYVWLRLGSRKNAVWLGAAIALAVLSKASWLILPPLLVVICIVFGMRNSPHWKWRPRLVQAMLVAGTCWLAIHAIYEFEGVLQPLGKFEFVSQTLRGHAESASPGQPPVGNRFRHSYLASIPSPLPADYVKGIDIQKRDFESGMASYFLGEWQDHGWWYYYAVGILLKEPIALWCLAGISLVAGWKTRWRTTLRTRRTARFVVLFPGLALIIFVSSQTGFNHHLRYVLPFLPALYLLVSAFLSKLPARALPIAYGLAVWYALSSVAMLPRTYAYFTEAVGGAANGWKYMGDSNLDWGQDILTAKRWIDSHPDKKPVFLLYSLPMVDFRKLGIDADDGRNSVDHAGPTRPGWWIVFARPMLEDKNQWFRKREPTEKLSVTTWVFEVPDDAIQR